MQPAYWVETETRWGTMVVNQWDQWVGASLRAYGEFSPGEWRFLQERLRPGDVALDIGANIGALTLAMAEAVRHTGHVHAFEPQPDVKDLLYNNTLRRSSTRMAAPITLYDKAVGAAPGTINIPVQRYDQQGNFGGVEFGGDEGTEVEVVTVDSLGLEQVALLKADVEGMEVEVLRGAVDTIKRCRPLLYLESDRAARRDELQELMRDLGYRLKFHMPPLFSPDNFRKLPFPLFHFVHGESLDNLLPIVEAMIRNDPPKLAEQLLDVIGEAAHRNQLIVSINVVGIPKEWPEQPWET